MRLVRSSTVVAALAAAAGVPAAAPAAAEPCSSFVSRDDKVSVVVDPGSLGGPVTWSCVEGGDGRTAAELTEDAGHDLEYVQGTSFVCRLGDRPGPDEESCGHTPPADAYWGLFWAEDLDAEWTYSTLGVTALTVPEGGVVGWRWQDGGDRDDPPALAGEPTTPTEPAAGAAEPASDEAADGAGAPVWAVGGVVLLLATALVLAARRRRADR